MSSSPHSSRGSRVPAESTEPREELTRKPSLLPAFEPLSSSPFPRPQSAKRKYNGDSPSLPKQQLRYYPTPVPTSSTGILHSSSPRNELADLARSISALSERVPLGDVPSVDLPANGEVLRMGRSSNSSDYQLSANRLISRVHVQAAYHAPSASNPSPWVEVECLGWNGAKIHCRGQVYELGKGAAWMSEDPEAEIMLDVQDARVMILWPATLSENKSSWDSEDDFTPTRRATLDHFASSPPIIPRSPVSQSPIRQPVFAGLTAPSPAPVLVFEDPDAGEENPVPDSPTPADETFIRPNASRSASIQDSPAREIKVQSSFLSSLASDDFSDADEENDPVVHSFGPFGENLLPRFESFSATTPTQASTSAQRRRRPVLTSESPLRRPNFKNSPIKNHVINQLAYSRLHSQPLSAIHGNLPAELKACAAKSSDDQNEASTSASVSASASASTATTHLSTQDLKRLMDDIPCVGEIPRSGKDAAGKPLENEFYYVPEMDTDLMRRDAVTGGMRGTGLRAVRKSHKQYYWKRPRH
ncbi:hypothetical protein K505DRAFT_236495 [Melanomma pulvis-pyrius CBS 109.77]|uniref:FHA domain-containing protein n=1 Tax=Melanomma pulvis-pyrius CBS 109.77 TaxID=1314802 RepID=A0A6A6XKM1_9PLEO|nr:hypothetical protein K505DRAFT_236495 [Melanomma pulvis-pyrius CBS 109.77]